ncbi:hypothetical protein PPERSA_11812 [Pseudocohnilembus persalinus]|uniref:Uncharacterized protein n=1 Tax=Pseudocohnilembus persalinus TaxID=266149 RepID=A0A0V0QR58_PSEPJ|nr:hypothetical protein PPERSA_11812 [Pseudocohnilembus persalinus]|eukprot:KRX04756.1 hypothetical protein PPERSA_11812 [Pseudocohnilembus persalinus]
MQQNQQDSSSNLHISDTSPIKQTQNQKQIDNYNQINQSASKQNIQQVTSHTNSRIGYSPMTNLIQNQNYNQLNQNIPNNNNLSSNSQLNTQVRKFDPQPLHSKSGIILLNNNLGANINDNREIVGNSNSNIKYTQNSQSDIKQFVTRTPHHIGNKNININSIANNELPVNKFDKIRGNKSLNSQKPNIPLMAGKIDANQNKNEQSKNTEDINNSSQVNVDQSSSQIYFRENALGQNQNQQQSNQNQQSLSLQKNSNSQHQTQQSQNNNNRSAFNNQNKNLSLSQVSQNIQNYNLQYQPKNNMNRFGSSTNSGQMANNSRLKIPNWQDSLKAEKENRKNQLLKDINIANFIKPDSWLKNAYFN